MVNRILQNFHYKRAEGCSRDNESTADETFQHARSNEALRKL